MNISHVVFPGRQRWEKQIRSDDKRKAASLLGSTSDAPVGVKELLG